MRFSAILVCVAVLLALTATVSAQTFGVRNAAATFPTRAFHASYALGNNLWVFNGAQNVNGNPTGLSDAWVSTNGGRSWTQRAGQTPWGTSYGLTVTPTGDGNKVVVVGGILANGNSRLTDLYVSNDGGVTFTDASGAVDRPFAAGVFNTAIPARAYHATTVLTGATTAQNQVVVIGGYDNTVAMNDVIVFNAGLTAIQARYTPAANSAWFTPRFGHAVVTAPNNLLVLTGGTDVTLTTNNEVWTSSTAGQTWTQLASTAAAFAPRYAHSMIYHATSATAGQIIVSGGSSGGLNLNTMVYYNDVFVSTAATPAFSAVAGTTSFVVRQGATLTHQTNNGELFLIGGSSYTGTTTRSYVELNDVFTAFQAVTYTTRLTGGLSQCLGSANNNCASAGQSQTGTQNQDFICTDSLSNATVANSFCTAPAAVACTLPVCYGYVQTGFTTCLTSTNANCISNLAQNAAGLRNPIFQCNDLFNNVAAATTNCGAAPAIVPAACTVPNCTVTYGYSYSLGTSCLTAAGANCFTTGQSSTGLQAYVLNCRDNNNNIVAANPNCNGLNASSVVQPAPGACTLPACAVTTSLVWVAGPTCLSSTGANCFNPAIGQTATGSQAFVLICRDTNGNTVANSNCNGLTTPPQPAAQACTLPQCAAAPFQYQSIGFSDYCVGTQTISVTGALANNGLYCLPDSTYSTVGGRAPIFVCTQGGIVVPTSNCVNAGLSLPVVAPQACTLLTCNPLASYVLVGRRQCINEQTYATCFNAGQSSTGVAQNIFQCAFNGAAATGRCSGAPQPSTTACVLPICSRTAVRGDPEFVGFRGQKYEIHGIPGSIFNIISSPHLQYNAEFVYLGAKSHRACNTTRTHPWTHPGTYLGKLGLQVGTDRVELHAGDCMKGIKKILVNGERVFNGAHIQFAEKQSMQVVDEYTVRLSLKEVDIEFTNSDLFFNQEVSMTKYGERTHQMHGLLGQTWAGKTYKDEKGQKHFIEGHPNDYLVQEDDLFGNDFVFNKWQA